MIFIPLFGAGWIFYMLDILTLVIVLPGFLFALWAQFRVKTSFAKYSKVPNSRGISGAEAARKVLSSSEVNVAVVPTRGNLTDNFNPKTETIYLSENVFGSSSVAAVGIAAHEAGHAVQYAENYFPLKLRSALVPVTKIGSYLAFPLAIIGVLIEWAVYGFGGDGNNFGTVMIAIGITLYSLSALFALITLPVELNASRRAKRALVSSGILTEKETRQAGKVLSAAALTYFASLAVSLLYLLRFILIISSLRRRK